MGLRNVSQRADQVGFVERKGECHPERQRENQTATCLESQKYTVSLAMPCSGVARI